jgi:DNA-binding transcriptional ArsR family regulator
MRRDAVVTPHRRGRFERWFVAGSLSLEERTLISALRVSTERRILEALLRFGPSRFGALVDRLSLPPSSLARSLDRLRSDGLVALERDRRYRLTDADALRMHLSGFRARFPDLLADAARDIFDETD